MADASKLKQLRRPGLGAPPPLDEARDFKAGADPVQAPPPPPAALYPTPSRVPEAEVEVGAPRIDGRSMRRSGRTVQFATRVSPEFDARIRVIAQRDKLLLVEVLERALDAYESRRVDGRMENR